MSRYCVSFDKSDDQARFLYIAHLQNSMDEFDMRIKANMWPSCSLLCIDEGRFDPVDADSFRAVLTQDCDGLGSSINYLVGAFIRRRQWRTVCVTTEHVSTRFQVLGEKPFVRWRSSGCNCSYRAEKRPQLVAMLVNSPCLSISEIHPRET
uniref:Uncharacterized protein n=1 Tax=Trichuris muris TaxID=70415 RepID=A0A5S6QUA8_TRIMR